MAIRKAAHAVLLCRMEERKVEWTETNKIDMIRRAHAQILHTQQFGNHSLKQGKSKGKSTVFRFYQGGMCQNQRDHGAGGYFPNMYVPLVSPSGRNMDIWLRIVGHPQSPPPPKKKKKKKKRTINALPWCSAAVNKINSMQSPVKSVIKVRQRIVYSNVCTHSCSANWRADWAMYVGKTYAQVLKSKPRNQNQNSINQVKDQHSFTKPSGLSKHQCR